MPLASFCDEIQDAPDEPENVPPFTRQVPVASIALERPQPVDPNAPSPSGTLDMDAVRAEIQRNAWRKGDFTITPYGALWFNGSFETQRTNNGDYALYVLSPSDDAGNDMNIDARSTRLGLNVAGPNLSALDGAKTGGNVEIDFQGQFVQENKGGLLLRHAYIETKDEDFRIVLGQTWDVISPLYPGTISYSVYWAAGNIGYRRAQLRGERYLALSDSWLLTTQGSMNVDLASELSPSGPFVFTNDHAGWPVFEGRTALTWGDRKPGGRPITLGMYGHIGEQVFNFLAPPPPARNTFERTWSFGIDLYAPITEKLGIQGEWYVGENLGAYLGGILQGVDLATRKPIGDRGGWIDVWYNFRPDLHSHLGYTIDSPNRRDLTVATERTYNAAYWGNLIYDVTPKFNLGLEVSSWRTLYVNRKPGDSVRIEFRAKYDF